MRTPEMVRNEKISHLEYCMEKLLQKDNGYNELEIKRLYTLFYQVVCKMREMDAEKALDYFVNSIDSEVRMSLNRLNIELVV